MDYSCWLQSTDKSLVTGVRSIDNQEFWELIRTILLFFPWLKWKGIKKDSQVLYIKGLHKVIETTYQNKEQNKVKKNKCKHTTR